MGIVFADGEIFSNLKLTQSVTDLLHQRSQFASPLQAIHVHQAITDALPALLAQDRVVYELYNNEQLASLLGEVDGIVSNQEKLASLIELVTKDALTYAEKFGVLSSQKKK